MSKPEPTIELRYLDGCLQYRTLTPSIDASGAPCVPAGWSDWHQVKCVNSAAPNLGTRGEAKASKP